MKYIATILSIIAILISVITLTRFSGEPQPESEKSVIPKVEVSHEMSRIHMYMNKLYFSGKEGNKALFNFYLLEISESMQDIADAKIEQDGVNISDNVSAFGIQSVNVLQKRIQDEGFVNFEEHYQNLVTSCNSCHKVSKRPYIAIQVPTTPALTNQDYKKGPYSEEMVDMDGD